MEGFWREHGLPLTIQRRVVLEALSAREDHPTADAIFDQVRRQLPEISRTTVYRVMETLVRVGAARKVSHPGASARYEMAGPRHHHLVCVECESMFDLEDTTLDAPPLPEAGGFEIQDFTVQFRGLCAACARKKKHEKSKRPGR